MNHDKSYHEVSIFEQTPPNFRTVNDKKSKYQFSKVKFPEVRE
jgi:hypothetical protein